MKNIMYTALIAGAFLLSACSDSVGPDLGDDFETNITEEESSSETPEIFISMRRSRETRKITEAFTCAEAPHPQVSYVATESILTFFSRDGSSYSVLESVEVEEGLGWDQNGNRYKVSMKLDEALNLSEVSASSDGQAQTTLIEGQGFVLTLQSKWKQIEGAGGGPDRVIQDPDFYRKGGGCTPA